MIRIAACPVALAATVLAAALILPSVSADAQWRIGPKLQRIDEAHTAKTGGYTGDPQIGYADLSTVYSVTRGSGPPFYTLGTIALVAAAINGALGYGFSSITVPLALLFLSNRVLNPALVLIEIPLNAYALWANREAVGRVLHRTSTLVAGLVPGVVAGTLIVSRVHPGWLRLWTFAVLLPLILLQAGGLRRPIRAERAIGLPFGCGVGLLYAVTTISGPPLALLLNNQGFAKREFRAALATIRLAESILTGVVYLSAGLFTGPSLALTPYILPSVIVGVPIGAWLIQHVRVDTFRRICMSFDAWIVGFGFSALLRQLHIIDSAAAYLALASVVLLDGWLLYRFFKESGAHVARPIASTLVLNERTPFPPR